MQIKQASTCQLHMGTTCARLPRCFLDPDRSREPDRNIFATRFKTRGGNLSCSSKVSRLSTRMEVQLPWIQRDQITDTEPVGLVPDMGRSDRLWNAATPARPPGQTPNPAGRQVPGTSTSGREDLHPLWHRQTSTRHRAGGPATRVTWQHADVTGPKSPLIITHTHTHKKEKVAASQAGLKWSVCLGTRSWNPAFNYAH